MLGPLPAAFTVTNANTAQQESATFPRGRTVTESSARSLIKRQCVGASVSRDETKAPSLVEALLPTRR